MEREFIGRSAAQTSAHERHYALYKREARTPRRTRCEILCVPAHVVDGTGDKMTERDREVALRVSCDTGDGDTAVV